MTSDQQPVRVGFLYPGFAAEDDYPRMAAVLGDRVAVEVVHTSVGTDAHREDALLDLGSSERLRAGAAELGARGVDAAVWACTSGSFVFGWEGARRQVDDLTDALGVPASSTSFAFVGAIEALGVRRVAIAATYPEDVALRFAEFLAVPGIETLAVTDRNIITAAEVGTLEHDAVLAHIAGGDHPDAEAVLVPDTALHTAAWIDEIEAALGKPVLTANQVSLWEALRLVGHRSAQQGLGRLFRAEPVRR